MQRFPSCPFVSFVVTIFRALAERNTKGMNPASCELLNSASQASAQADFDKAEQALKQALELDPRSIEALRAAARFYFSAKQDPAKARHYAALCVLRTNEIGDEMNEILEEQKPRKIPASRHIGGIIGPY